MVLLLTQGKSIQCIIYFFPDHFLPNRVILALLRVGITLLHGLWKFCVASHCCLNSETAITHLLFRFLFENWKKTFWHPGNLLMQKETILKVTMRDLDGFLWKLSGHYANHWNPILRASRAYNRRSVNTVQLGRQLSDLQPKRLVNHLEEFYLQGNGWPWCIKPENRQPIERQKWFYRCNTIGYTWPKA